MSVMERIVFELEDLGRDLTTADCPGSEVQISSEKFYIYYWKVLGLHKRRNGIILRVERESAQRRSLCLVFNLNLYRWNKSPLPPSLLPPFS